MQFLECYRLVTFVPVPALEKLIDAVCESGLLTYGNYGEVLWFSAPGTGQFRPLEGANPAIGEKGVRERVAESRVEFSILKDEANLKALMGIVIAAHPYEEPVVCITSTKETRTQAAP